MICQISSCVVGSNLVRGNIALPSNLSLFMTMTTGVAVQLSIKPVLILIVLCTSDIRNAVGCFLVVSVFDVRQLLCQIFCCKHIA